MRSQIPAGRRLLPAAGGSRCHRRDLPGSCHALHQPRSFESSHHSRLARIGVSQPRRHFCILTARTRGACVRTHLMLTQIRSWHISITCSLLGKQSVHVMRARSHKHTQSRADYFRLRRNSRNRFKYWLTLNDASTSSFHGRH